MTIALRAQGAWIFGANSITPVIPAAQLTGDMMLLIVTGKPFDSGWSAPGDWTSLGSGASGNTAAGVDTGSMKTEVFYKVATSDTETNPLVTEGSPAWNVVGAAVCVFSKTAGSWATPVAVFAADEVTGTALSFTFASDPGGLAGDYVLLACGINTDAMGPLTTDLTPVWTGITFGTADAGLEGETTSGGDMSGHYMSRPVSSGTSSAAPTATGTGTATGAADRAEAVFVRLREAAGVVQEGDASLQGVATSTVDGSGQLQGESTEQAVATLSADGSLAANAESNLQGVAELTADAEHQVTQRRVRHTIYWQRRGGSHTFISRPQRSGVAAGFVVHEAEANLQGVAFTTIDGSGQLQGESSLQAVATFTSDGTLGHQGESSLQSVATSTVEGSVVAGGEVTAQGVAFTTIDATLTYTAEATAQGVATLEADAEVQPSAQLGEAVLVGVAHMGFDPQLTPRPVSWYRVSQGKFYPADNGRRVRGRRETTGRRIF